MLKRIAGFLLLYDYSELMYVSESLLYSTFGEPYRVHKEWTGKMSFVQEAVEWLAAGKVQQTLR